MYNTELNYDIKIPNMPTVTLSEEPKLEEKWVWVTGYKGMDKNMQCKNNFQYEIGKTYDMPEGEEVSVCSSGFHMCLDLKDVYDYVSIGNGNRFFEVRALVRERDTFCYTPRSGAKSIYAYMSPFHNKLAAKSIEIVRELSVDEILAHIHEAAEWPGIIKDIALADGVEKATAEWHTRNLMHMGYSEKLAKYICGCKDNSGYDLAVALDSQPDISMDTKVLAIFSHI